ncbi:MAG: hypothetical protein Q9175_006697 [Cornicularia normoerica]
MTQDPAQLLAQADKAYSSVGSGFGSWFGLSKNEKYENAAELYIKAGVAYRIKEKWRESGMAYEKAATIQGTKLDEPNDMANTLQDAFKAYKREYPEDAARCLSQAIEHYLNQGNFRRAATQKQNLAELYEEQNDSANARSAYAVAAQWYEDDNAPALANKFNLKAAEYSALDSDYLDAIKRFEHVAKLSVSSSTMRYSVNRYLWQAGICHLALDIIGAKRALENYRELDPQFPSAPEGVALAGLSEAVERGDIEAFKVELAKYFGPRELKSWDTTILTRIKNELMEKDEDFS